MADTRNTQPLTARINGVLHLLLEVFALATLAFWGYLAWPFPWPALFFVVGSPLFAALIWWLFRSRNAPLPLDPVGKAVVEFLLLGSVVAAWFMLDYPVVGAVFGVVAAVSSIMCGRTEIVKDQP